MDAWETRYYESRFINLACDERARLVLFARKWEKERRYLADVVIDPRRLEFVRWLVQTGRISEGVE